MNKIYEFGSSVDIILRVKSDKIIGGIEYKAGQIYTILKDCGIGFSYAATNSEMTAKKPIFNGDIINLIESIMVNNVPITDKVANLIFGYQGSQQFKKSVVETIVVGGSGAYLKYTPVSDLFIMSKRDNSILAADAYTVSDDYIEFNMVDVENEYLVQYKTLSNGVRYDLESDYFGYFDIEVIGEGNIDKITKKTYLFFPSVKITQVPQIDLDNEGVCSTPFVFNMIYEGQDKPYIVFED